MPRYNAAMRRPLRLGLILTAALVVAGAASYTAYWLIAAGQLKDGVARWTEEARAQGLAASWQSIRVGGYPFAFRVRLTEPRVVDEAVNPAAELSGPLMLASARPWDLNVWQTLAPQGLKATLRDPAKPPAGQPLVRVSVDASSGAVSVASDGAVTVWLTLDGANAETGSEPADRVAARTANGWLVLPARPPHSHTERYLGFGADLYGLTVPQAPSPFGRTIDNLSIGLTVKGMIPAGPVRQSAEAWRQSGGTIELDHFRLFWDALGVTGTGTAALDRELQPVGAFSGAIEGYDKLIAAMVVAGRMRAGDASLAAVALSLLAKSGPDGKLSISTSFTIDKGEMYLGPAKLGKMPRIAWQ